MPDRKVTTIKDAQKLVRKFAADNEWVDLPNVDKFDHLHEELIEMSKHLRYKSEEERISEIHEHPEIFIDGIGDLFFAMCRLANQLDVDIEDAFNLVSVSIISRYNQKGKETKTIK
jgi:NTP pyrophosphatase (non-canonical NTP hydrolase)